MSGGPERKRKTKTPCARCGMNETLCLCALIPRLDLATKVVLIIHAKELKRTTNSGKLACEALVNSEIRVRGATKDPVGLGELVDERSGYDSLLFFPSADAVELNAEFLEERRQRIGKPFQLLVPDGNWRQAAKVATRHSEFDGLPRVVITRENKALHHLRAETSSFGMSTLEAVARALGFLEGPSVEAAMLKLYAEKLKRTLEGRGIRPIESREKI